MIGASAFKGMRLTQQRVIENRIDARIQEAALFGARGVRVLVESAWQPADLDCVLAGYEAQGWRISRDGTHVTLEPR